MLGEEALPSIRIVPAGEYYDYHAKYVADTTQYICPGLEGQAGPGIGTLALRAFRAAGCPGWGRVDVMRDRSGRNFLLEMQHVAGHDEPFARPEGRARRRASSSTIWCGGFSKRLSPKVLLPEQAAVFVAPAPSFVHILRPIN